MNFSKLTFHPITNLIPKKIIQDIKDNQWESDLADEWLYRLDNPIVIAGMVLKNKNGDCILIGHDREGIHTAGCSCCSTNWIHKIVLDEVVEYADIRELL